MKKTLILLLLSFVIFSCSHEKPKENSYGYEEFDIKFNTDISFEDRIGDSCLFCSKQIKSINFKNNEPYVIIETSIVRDCKILGISSTDFVITDRIRFEDKELINRILNHRLNNSDSVCNELNNFFKK